MCSYSLSHLRALLVPLIALILLPVHAYPATSGISDPEGGYQGFFRPGEWTPFTVTIERKSAKTPSKDGLISVEARPLEGDPRLFRKSVDLASQQRIRATVYAQISNSASCKVTYKDETGPHSWQLRDNYLKALMPHQKLLLMINRETLRPDSNVRLDNTVMAHMLPEQLPDIWQALESVDLVVFGEDPSTGMPEETKRRALMQWIRFGGRVLCIGGVNTQNFQNGFLAPILPVNLDATSPFDLNGTPFLASRMTLKPNAQALWAKDGRLLAAHWNVGAGDVTFAGLDLEAAAGKDPMASALWDSIVYAPNKRPHLSMSNEVTSSNVDFAFGKAARLPPLILVFVLLGTYTVLVGPVNFYMLKKRRRLELAWLTIPAIVAVFSVMTYMIGSATKGGITLLREMELIEMSSGDPEGRVEKIASLFSPKKRSYTLAVNNRGGTLTTFSRWQSFDSTFFQGVPFGGKKVSTGEAGWTLNVDQDIQSMKLNDRLFGQWTSQSFTGDSVASLGGPLVGEAVLKNNKIELSVQNQSKTTLENAIIRIGLKGAALGRLAPGEKAALTFDVEEQNIAQGAIDPNTGEQIEIAPREDQVWMSITTALDEDLRGYSQTQALQRDQQDDSKNVSEFLRGRLWNSNFAPALSPAVAMKSPLQPVLVAWIPQSPDPLVVDVKPDQYAYAGMVVMDLPLRLGEGPLMIPAAYSVGELVDFTTDDQMSDVSYGTEGYATNKGELTFACSPGIHDRRFRIFSPRLIISAGNTNGYTVTVTGYDFELGRWRFINRLSSDLDQPLAASLCSPIDGTAYIKISITAGTNPMQQQGMNEAVKIASVKMRYDGEVTASAAQVESASQPATP